MIKHLNKTLTIPIEHQEAAMYSFLLIFSLQKFFKVDELISLYRFRQCLIDLDKGLDILYACDSV